MHNKCMYIMWIWVKCLLFQVVRSVAFSGSGKFVAVGANSRMLRVCSTTSLLEKKEKLVFLHINYKFMSINYSIQYGVVFAVSAPSLPQEFYLLYDMVG